MKRVGGLWLRLVSFDNLLLAYRKARRGKRARPGVAEFELGLERNLLALQDELVTGRYRPGAYRQFTIYERKPRLITAAPFRDRVLHHAVMNVIEAPIDRRFIHDSYACRIGKGVYKAVNRYQRWCQRYRFALKLDVRSYFPSIDHEILKAKLRRHLKDQRTLELLDRIIGASPDYGRPLTYFPGDDLFSPVDRRVGIPIGNLTSQFFANLYLDAFDHFVKDSLRVRAYLRYVDDIILLDNDPARLHELRLVLAERLERDRLELHARKGGVMPVCTGVDVLGYRVFPAYRLLRNDNGHRFSRKLRRFAVGYARGRLALSDIDPSVQSWLGHAGHADTLGLRGAIFGAARFSRGAGQAAASA
ncbi:MAG: RNA-directed DNA polymerase [Gammaproteobacteria bacterium]|nr:RNA-directed DNA polymerase [Gammaproteobacteria bacterium]NIU06314.1 RNA-directed DNA polymerase [Gammaproteobacteria bacterium]NIV52879.1 RNA-dependent DNA polymerase [Gammaproteobacteria bacterium]NIX87587.1 RNA-dependent DNA polymerase [Gammaproteobacteria bacterium]